MRNKHLILALAFLAAGSLSAAAQAKTADAVGLVVDQDVMTKGELDESIQTYLLEQHMKPSAPGAPEYEEAKKQIVEGFVREVLMAEEADRQKMEIQPGEVDQSVDQEIESMKKNFKNEQEFNESLQKEGITIDDLKQDAREKILRRMKAGRILRMKQQELPGSVLVSDADAQAYYTQHPGDFEKVKFAIILFRVSEKATSAEAQQVKTQAQNVLKQIKAGADFGEMAKKYSEDPGSAAEGGEVGTVARTDIGDSQLAKGVFSLPEKGLGLVRASEGFYVVRVNKKGKSDYASVAGDIKAHLKGQKQQGSLTNWFNGLKKNAYIMLDGKVLSAESVGAGVSPAATATPAAAPATMTEEDRKLFNVTAAYPSLPTSGGLDGYVGVQGFLVPTSDLGNYYTPLNTNQDFPFGLGIFGGLEIAIDPTLQVGVKVEGMRKFAEKVTDGSGYTDQWDSTAIGAALTAKILVPMDESTNFILYGSGGYYALLSANVTITGPSVAEDVNLSGSNFGGEAGGMLEFLLDDHNSQALDIGLGYRFLKFSPVTSNVTVAGPVPFLSPLKNVDGSDAGIDFSGVQFNVGVRFFFDKTPEKED